MKQGFKRTTAAVLAALILASVGTSVAVFSEAETNVVRAEEVPNEDQPVVNGRTISADTTWDQETTLSGDLVVESGVTLTIGAKVTISGNVTISGGGTIQRGDSYTGASSAMILVPQDATLTLENITLDGGAIWGDRYSEEKDISEQIYSILGHSTANNGIYNAGPILQVAGSVDLSAGTVIQNNDGSISNSGAASAEDVVNSFGVYISGGNVTMKAGAVICDCLSKFGAAVYVSAPNTQSTGQFIMEGGTISGNISTRNESYTNAQYTGGGGIRAWRGKVYIHGGEIKNNVALKDGGGICVNDRGSNYLEVTGGHIYNNYAAKNGGGICFANSGFNSKFIGGTIEKNTSIGDGAGVYVGLYSYAQLGGNLVVRDNLTTDNKPSNFSIYGGNTSDRIISTSDDAEIHISIRSQDADKDYKYIKIVPDPDTAFESENLTALISDDSDKIFWHVKPEDGGTATAQLDNRPQLTVSADKTSIVTGKSITLTANVSYENSTATYTYQWYKDGVAISDAAESQLVVTEAGQYTVKVTISAGQSTAKVTQSAPALTFYKPSVPIPSEPEPEKPTVDPVQNVTAVKKATDWLKLNFDKVEGADGYEIYNAATNEKLADCTTQNGRAVLTKTVTGLSKGTTYKLQVRAYKLVDGERVYGDFSKVYTKATAHLDKVTGVRPIKKTQTTLKIQFNKVEGAERYRIFDAETGKMLCTVSTQNGANVLKKTITGLNAGERRQYKVRAYATIDGKNEYGEFSKTFVKATAE